MNFSTQLLHLAGSGAVAFISARSLRDLKTRPNVLAGFHLAESGSVPFLQALRDRAQSEGNSWLAERLVMLLMSGGTVKSLLTRSNNSTSKS